MRNFYKTVVFLSAFAPILFSIAVSRFLSKGFCIDEVWYTLASAFGVISGIIVMRLLRNYGQTLTFKAKKIEATDATMLAVVSTYVVPFIGKASEITFTAVFGLTCLLASVLWITSALIPHPALRFLKYRFYKVESENGVVFTLITTRDLIDPKDITQVKKITNSMILEVR